MQSPNKFQTIIATEHDGFKTNTLVIHCEILNNNPAFNLQDAVQAAVTDYLHTPDGKRIYEYNCRNFDWSDFETNVPNELCENHGFRKLETTLADIHVNWDEHLADDEDFDEFWEKNL